VFIFCISNTNSTPYVKREIDKHVWVENRFIFFRKIVKCNCTVTYVVRKIECNSEHKLYFVTKRLCVRVETNF
jgi:hypothetical protein